MMAELTEQQLDQAAAAYGMAYGGDAEGPSDARREGLRAAAPFLQIPWEPPTKEEAKSFHENYYTFASTSIPSTLHALRRFIANRNAALLPKPVDPRFEKIRSALVYHASHRFNQLITPNQFDEAALAVLTALGEVK